MMNDEIINNYHKGSLVDKILLLSSLVLFVISVTLYAMSAVIPSNLIHPDDYQNSVNYIELVLIVMRILSSILAIISGVLVLVVRSKIVIKKYKDFSDTPLFMIIYFMLLSISILIFWIDLDKTIYKIIFYYIIFPVFFIVSGYVAGKKSLKLQFSLMLFYCFLILFQYHLTFGMYNESIGLHFEYLILGFVPYTFGVIFYDFFKKLRKQ